jgi:hypothetical protein
VKAHKNSTSGRRNPAANVFKAGLLLMLAVSIFLGLLTPLMADDPKPDPAGIVTGDKTNAVDAGGNAFMVTEPTDKAAPTYTQAKKDFDEFKAQADKEPLAVKLADSVGHVRVATTGRGACWNHPINSSSAMLYTRFVIGEETLSSTSVFNFSQPAIF